MEREKRERYHIIHKIMTRSETMTKYRIHQEAVYSANTSRSFNFIQHCISGRDKKEHIYLSLQRTRY